MSSVVFKNLTNLLARCNDMQTKLWLLFVYLRNYRELEMHFYDRIIFTSLRLCVPNSPMEMIESHTKIESYVNSVFCRCSLECQV